MPENDAPQSSIIPYQTEEGRTRIQGRFEDQTIWLTQAQLTEAATIKSYLQVRIEGARQVSREVLQAGSR